MKEPNIRLRALELEDLDFLYQIENDDRLWELGVSNVPYSRRVLLDYITSASADIYVDNQVRLIVENEQNEQVGILDLTDFDPRHRRAELVLVKLEIVVNVVCHLASTPITHRCRSSGSREARFSSVASHS